MKKKQQKKKKLGKLIPILIALVITATLATVIFINNRLLSNIDRTSANSGITYYVATNGNDNWAGTLPNPSSNNGPFRTIQKAQQAVRALKQSSGLPAGGVLVLIRGGFYELSSPITFVAEDSGTSDRPVIYRGYENERPIISGGKRIPENQFSTITDSFGLTRINNSVRDRVKSVNLAAIGITSIAAYEGRHTGLYGRNGTELYIDGSRGSLARWPNGTDWVYTTACPSTSGGQLCHESSAKRYTNWASTSEAMVHTWLYDFSDITDRLVSVNPSGNSFNIPSIYTVSKDRRFAFLNVPEELDNPGEYFIDRDRKMLYVYPTNASSIQNYVLSNIRYILNFENASFISIENLQIEYSQEHNIKIELGESIKIAGNIIRNSSNDAVRIMSGKNHLVLSNNISKTGDGGVRIRGVQDNRRETSTFKGSPSNITVENNDISLFSQTQWAYRPGIASLSDANNSRIRHNYIHNGRSMAINLDGSNYVVEYNRIDDVVQNQGDMGAVYTLNVDTGNIIRYNYISRVDRNNFYKSRGQGSYAAQGIYLDNQTKNHTVIGNVIQNGGRRGIFSNSGSNHIIKGNVLIGGEERGIDLTYVYWEDCSYKQQAGCKPDVKPVNNTIVANAVVNIPFPYHPNTTNNYFWVLPKSTFCSENAFNPICPEDPLNYVASNVNEVATLNNEGFVSSINNSNLRSKMSNFDPIPFEKIGLYQDEYRIRLSGLSPLPPPTSVPTQQPTINPTIVPTRQPVSTPPPSPINTPTEGNLIINARGTSAKNTIADANALFPLMEVRVNGQVVSDILNRTQVYISNVNEDYVYNVPNIETVEVAYLNDAETDPNADRNMQVNNINVNGTYINTQDPTVYSTGTWTSENGCGPGYKQNVWLHCEGFFRFTLSPTQPENTPTPTAIPTLLPTNVPTVQPTIPPTPTLTPIQSSTRFIVRARGTSARNASGNVEFPRMAVKVNGVRVRDTNNQLEQFVTDTYRDYTYRGTNIATIEVEYLNDTEQDPEADRNMQVDYVIVDGFSSIFQTESDRVYSEGTWTSNNGCGGGNKQSDWLHCRGFFRYTISNEPQAIVPQTLEAESFTSTGGRVTVSPEESRPGVLARDGYIYRFDPDDFVTYTFNNPIANYNAVALSIKPRNTLGTIEVLSGSSTGNVIGSISGFTNTGLTQSTWQSLTIPISPPTLSLISAPTQTRQITLRAKDLYEIAYIDKIAIYVK